MNRIQASILATRAKVDALNGVGKDGTPLSAVDAKMALTLEEFTYFHNIQAMGYATGKLSQEEANTIYRLLGGESYHKSNGGWAPEADLAAKMVVTRVIAELIDNQR